MKHLYILRGPSGCGKSTLAGMLGTTLSNMVICSANDFFETFGEYHFDKEKLHEAHKFCKQICETSMSTGVEHIVIDNTNMKVWEYMPYVQLAEEHGYSYSVIVVGRPWNPAELAKRSKHGMTEDQIRLQISRFAHFV